MNTIVNLEELKPKTNLDLLAKQVVEGFITGLHKSPFHGFSVEFAEHRPYHPSENIKSIDWKLYGRTDKMYVKRYEEETNLRCQFVLDVSSSMYYPQTDFSKMRFSVLAVAALTELLKSQRDAFGLSVFNEDLLFSSNCKSTTAHQKLIFSELEKALAGEYPKGKSSIAKSLHKIAEKIHQRSMVVIFSDMFENTEEEDKLFEALQHLKYNKHEVILFHVMDFDTELDFNFDNRPYLFVDVESGEEIKLHANAIRDKYTENMKAHIQRVQDRCHQEKIELILSNAKKGYNEILFEYLIKRQRMP